MKLFKMILTISAFALSVAHAQQPEDPFRELEQEMTKLEAEGTATDIEAFQAWKEAYLSEYQTFRQEHFQKIDDIRDRLIDLWGESDPQRKSEAIHYSPDQRTKTVIDFEKNEVRISILHDTNQKIDSSNVVNTIDETIKSANFAQSLNKSHELQALKSSVGDAKVLERETDLVANPDKLLKQEIDKIESQSREQTQQLEKIVDMALVGSISSNASMEALTQVQISTEVAQINKEKQARIEKLKGKINSIDAKKKREALKNKKVTTYIMPLQQANFLKKADPFKGDVTEYSQRWELPESLLFAIIHTESYFNPIAQSHIPAFGLMQIVPRSAGIDVNRFLYNKEAIMTKEYLFQPSKNIETGIAYIHLLDSRYLAKIENVQSRFYCIIAAYNTGTGNVAKTFNKDKSRNIGKAAMVINQMTPQEVYDRLVSNLPYKETQQYLEKVVRRQSIYKVMDSI